MQPNKCMWLHLVEADDTANEMVLTSQEGRAIVHNKQRGDASQRWTWNGKQIINEETKAQLFDDGGDATVAKTGSVWWYDSET